MVKILIADDNIPLLEDTARFVRKRIKSSEVIIATNGLKAKSLLEANLDVDLLVTDLNMPWMNGYELVNSLSGLGYTGRVIISSGDDVDQSLIKYDANKVRYVGKEESIETFQKAIEDSLSQR